MRAVVLAAALLLVPAGASATDTEADAIRAVYDDWSGFGTPSWLYWTPPAFDHQRAMLGLDELYADAGPACQSFILGLYLSIALIDSGRYSPANHLGSQAGFTLLVSNFEATEYACRIAI